MEVPLEALQEEQVIHWPMNSGRDKDNTTCSGETIRVPCFHTFKQASKKWVPTAATQTHYLGTTDLGPHPLSQPARSSAATQNYTLA